MPDITMCNNSKCSIRYKCFRYLARPDKHWQLMGSFEGGEKCKSFLNSQYYSLKRMYKVEDVDQFYKELQEKKEKEE